MAVAGAFVDDKPLGGMLVGEKQCVRQVGFVRHFGDGVDVVGVAVFPGVDGGAGDTCESGEGGDGCPIGGESSRLPCDRLVGFVGLVAGGVRFVYEPFKESEVVGADVAGRHCSSMVGWWATTPPYVNPLDTAMRKPHLHCLGWGSTTAHKSGTGEDGRCRLGLGDRF